MLFDDAMYEVLQTGRYDFLTGRRADIGTVLGDLFERIIFSFFEWLNLDALSINVPGGFNINTIATIFAVVGLIIIAITMVILYRALSRPRQDVDYDLSDIFEELANRNYTVEELLNISQTAGDRRISVRYGYIAVLLALDEKEIIRISPSATNRIIFREIKNAAPGLANPFLQVVDVFHLSWFGYKNVDDEDFLNFSGVVSALVNEVGEPK